MEYLVIFVIWIAFVVLKKSIKGAFKKKPKRKRFSGSRFGSGKTFDFSIPSVLYYVRVENHGKTAYKIGVTNRNAKRRYYRDYARVTVLAEWSYSTGKEAYREEQRLLKKYKRKRYHGQRLLFSGDSELFKSDVLGLDKGGIAA
jgi:hypothetical protein